MRLLPASMGTLSLSTTGNSTAINVQSMFGYCIVGVVTGSSPTGTLALFISDDGTTYQQMTKSDYAITTTGTFVWEVGFCRHKFVRIGYTSTSGTGSCVLTIEGKGF